MKIKKDDHYYETQADKRTKEYKKWKKMKEAKLAKESKGLGDDVQKLTKATGIEFVVKKVFGDDCGCDKRKEWLNTKIKYAVKQCATEEQYWYLKSYFRRERPRGPVIEVFNKLVEISNYVFGENKVFNTSDCSDCSNGEKAKLINRLEYYLEDIEKLIEEEVGGEGDNQN